MQMHCSCGEFWDAYSTQNIPCPIPYVHCTIVERGVISQIELLYVLVSLDSLTEEISIAFWFRQYFVELIVSWKFRTHIILEQNVIFTK